MSKKRWFMGGAAAFFLIGIAAIAGVLSAQESDFISDFRDLIKVKSGDDTVVATIDGTDFKKRDVRLGSDIVLAVEPGISEDEAVRQSILSKVDDYVIRAEAERRGLMPTIAEAREYMEIHQEMCMGPDGAECREFMESMGFNPEDYWTSEDVIEAYRNDLTGIRVMGQLHQEWQAKVDEGLIPAEDDDIVTLKILDELRGDAEITWKDKRLGNLFEEAQAARTNELLPPPSTPVVPGNPNGPPGPVGNAGEGEIPGNPDGTPGPAGNINN